MTSLCGRILVSTARKSITYTSVRFAGPDGASWTPLEHATGIEKRERLAMAAGNDNPFDMKVFPRAEGTKDKPTLIPSAFDARIVGCICHEDQTYVNWMWLHKGHPKRCECGYWFDLIYKAPV